MDIDSRRTAMASSPALLLCFAAVGTATADDDTQVSSKAACEQAVNASDWKYAETAS